MVDFGEGSEEMGRVPSSCFLTQAQKDRTQPAASAHSYVGLLFWTLALVPVYVKQLVTKTA